MSRRYFRPGVLIGHVLVLAAALTCLRLGWWQWGVFEYANRGTVQNLGYSLLWPVFAGAFIYMWLRFLHLESVRDAETADPSLVGDGGDGVPGIAPTDEDTDGDGASGGVPVGDGEAGPGSVVEATVGAQPGPDGEAAADSVTAEGSENSTGPAEDADEAGDPGETRRARHGHRGPHEAYTIAVATVGDDDEDDPELAAYNRALAALAEQDRRRAR